jgi:hypothetical protein
MCKRNLKDSLLSYVLGSLFRSHTPYLSLTSKVLTFRMATEFECTIFCMTPSGELKDKAITAGTFRLHLQGRRLSRARDQSESRSVIFQQTIRHYIAEHNTLHDDCCENLKFCDSCIACRNVGMPSTSHSSHFRERTRCLLNIAAPPVEMSSAETELEIPS